MPSKGKRTWRWLWLAALLACGIAGLGLAVAGLAASPPDAVSPMPGSTLVHEEAFWSDGQFFAIRIYHAPARIEQTLEWYYGEGVIPRFARNNPYFTCAERDFHTARPSRPFPTPVLGVTSHVVFCSRPGHTEVSVVSRYRLQLASP